MLTFYILKALPISNESCSIVFWSTIGSSIANNSGTIKNRLIKCKIFSCYSNWFNVYGILLHDVGVGIRPFIKNV